METTIRVRAVRRLVATAAVGVIAIALSLPALAAPRHSGGRSASAPHSGSHGGGHYAGAARGAGHYAGVHHHGPRFGAYLGVPLVAAAAYYGPRYYYPPAYVAPPPQVLYYCAAYNDYYPRVPVCPSGWQQVIQPPGAPYY